MRVYRQSPQPPNQVLFDERLKPPIQRRQPLTDKFLLITLIAAFIGAILFIPLDVCCFRLMSKPATMVSSLGRLLFATGWWLIPSPSGKTPYLS
jgi:hypothetical protein